MGRAAQAVRVAGVDADDAGITLKGGATAPTHHFGVSISELLLGPTPVAVPRVLVYMCEYVLLAASRMSASRLLARRPPRSPIS